MRYAVIVEQGETSYGAYVPDLPGCVAVAETKDEVIALIKDAIEFHLEGIKQEGQAIPLPSSPLLRNILKSRPEPSIRPRKAPPPGGRRLPQTPLPSFHVFPDFMFSC